MEGLKAALADRYTLERELGRGGMATVYLARDLRHDRPVALKVLRSELGVVLGPARFLQEIRFAAKLQHPHILPVFDSGETAGHLWYTMPYVQGEALRARLRRETQLPLEEAVRITVETADALDYAHRHGVVHRDIKPENILLEEGHAVVSDFGIAVAIEGAGTDRLTGSGLALGTPTYMSPEQAAGERTLDGRSDIYALGCVLYEMLAGEPPFTGPSPQAVVARRLAEPPPPLGIVRDVPEGVEQVVARALARAPADRFQNAVEFADALAASSAAVGSFERPATSAARLRRRRRLVALALAAVVTMGSGLLVLRFASEVRAPIGRAPDRTAVAVLPFQNLSADGAHAYFAAGLHGELLTQLSRVAALTVISRTSVMGYAGRDAPLRQIATELGVRSVVEGSVQVVNGRLRVNVDLVDAASDAHLWAERYDRALDDAFAIQSEVAQRIAAAVGAALSGPERKALANIPTSDPEAYRLYLQGREYLARPGYLRLNWESAEQLFDRALALDPDFAPAHAAVSEVHGRMYWTRHDPSPARLARQQGEAETALRLAPDSPDAHFAMGLSYYWGRRDYRHALQEFRTALQGRPGDARIWHFIGAVNRRLGNWDEVAAAFEQARRLNPRDPDLLYDGGYSFLAMHRYRDAIRAYDQAFELAPDLYGAALQKGWTFALWQGQLDTLRAVLSRVPDEAALGPKGTRARHQAQLLYWARQPDSLLRALELTRLDRFEGQDLYLPTSLYGAWAHQMRGDSLDARAAFDSARALLDSVLQQLPNDWRVHAARGLALAGLGRHGEARHEADWLQRSIVYREDAMQGPQVAEDRARILAQTGDAGAALNEIERLLVRPSWLSGQALRLDPLWDKIRDDSRFRELLTKYPER